MEKQIIGNKYKLFDLQEEEKEVFIAAVNKLPKNVYKRGETYSSNFLVAINNNNTKDAMDCFMKISWKGVALKILHAVHALHGINDKTLVNVCVENIFSDAAKYKREPKQLEFKKCPECNELVTNYDDVCLCCGTLLNEV